MKQWVGGELLRNNDWIIVLNKHLKTDSFQVNCSVSALLSQSHSIRKALELIPDDWQMIEIRTKQNVTALMAIFLRLPFGGDEWRNDKSIAFNVSCRIVNHLVVCGRFIGLSEFKLFNCWFVCFCSKKTVLSQNEIFVKPLVE